MPDVAVTDDQITATVLQGWVLSFFRIEVYDAHDPIAKL